MPASSHHQNGPAARRRWLLKLSGQALAAASGQGIAETALSRLVSQLDLAKQQGVEVALVLGGGNLIRGAQLSYLERVTADRMGMLATVINALALQESLRQAGLVVRHQSAVPLSWVEGLDPHLARQALQRGELVIFSGGTGSPLVTTDTAAALRAVEIGADCLLKATQVDGVYTADPQRDPQARRLEQISYDEVIRRELGVMDLAALVICREYQLSVRVFSAWGPEDNLKRALAGEPVGTLISRS
ncbi:MAG TPA: uridine monophosphate kinase [Candidatus Fraserbacteria bacterium]|nr:uridine monophosphate kinase [Candidatus Fraserbacteria bacterium]